MTRKKLDRALYMPALNPERVDADLAIKIRRQIEASVLARHDYATHRAAIERIETEHSNAVNRTEPDR